MLVFGLVSVAFVSLSQRGGSSSSSSSSHFSSSSDLVRFCLIFNQIDKQQRWRDESLENKFQFRLFVHLWLWIRTEECHWMENLIFCIPRLRSVLQNSGTWSPLNQCLLYYIGMLWIKWSILSTLCHIRIYVRSHLLFPWPLRPIARADHSFGVLVFRIFTSLELYDRCPSIGRRPGKGREAGRQSSRRSCVLIRNAMLDTILYIVYLYTDNLDDDDCSIHCMYVLVLWFRSFRHRWLGCLVGWLVWLRWLWLISIVRLPWDLCSPPFTPHAARLGSEMNNRQAGRQQTKPPMAIDLE